MAVADRQSTSAPRNGHEGLIPGEFKSNELVRVDSKAGACRWRVSAYSKGVARLGHYDIYATYSKNSGSSFATNARVTAAQINAGKAGIAAAVATSGTKTGHPVWTNGGFNGGTLQTAALTLP